MKLNDFKNILSGLNHPAFALPMESMPSHYHLTEVERLVQEFRGLRGNARTRKCELSTMDCG